MDALPDLYWRWRWVKAYKSAIERGAVWGAVREEYVLKYNRRRFWWMKELR